MWLKFHIVWNASFLDIWDHLGRSTSRNIGGIQCFVKNDHYLVFCKLLYNQYRDKACNCGHLATMHITPLSKNVNQTNNASQNRWGIQTPLPRNHNSYLGRYRIPRLGHPPLPPFPAGSVATNSPPWRLPFTLKEYHTSFKAPLLQPRYTSLPVTADSASRISFAEYVLYFEG